MTTPRPDEEATVRVGSDAKPARSGRSAAVQFAPGTIIAGRYRIAGILGSGGMGEVYRADDTKLDQVVALKFLPARLARDPILLARLHDEVRLGRQVSHPNVCRIYDIVDWEDLHFVAMEHVDGEDLSRLLRRIGRIAHDKAVDIARDMAAGLMGAHARGILHRDLKPANVMIDSRGDARIMDFGLALASGEDDGTIAGTPAYMAPEVLDGRPATVQSDLYALGLVMYELFTGKRAHGARTLAERLREMTSEITTPSSVVRDIDPAVERVILRCLHHDPAQRPGSAREVILALPGGDPLAAAMAAGETPSPRIVAAAGTEGTLRPSVAWGLLAVVVGLLALLLLRTQRSGFLRNTTAREPLEVQAARARDLIRDFGIPSQEFEAAGLQSNSRYIAWIFAKDRSPLRWQRLRRGPPAVVFWLREERAPFLDTRPGSTLAITPEWPPQFIPGSVEVETDARGRLVSLSVLASDQWKSRPLDWNTLLRAAGMDATHLAPAPPQRTPASFADQRAAWNGKHPDDGTPIHIEAAAYRGIPVSFHIAAPWDEVDDRGLMPFAGESFDIAVTIFGVAAIALGIALAWRNLRIRRGDRAGALRVGVAVMLAAFVYFLLSSNHELLIQHELNILYLAVSKALAQAATVALIYIALEPFVRRKWPDRLISWARLVSGNWRDPMIGRDVLIGIAAGLMHALAAATAPLLGELVTGRSAQPFSGDVGLLAGVTQGVAYVAWELADCVLVGLILMIVLMALTIVLRRRSLAVVAFFTLLVAIFSFASREPWMIPLFVLISALYTLMVSRFGLLSMASTQLAFGLVYFYPLPDAAAWYTARGLITVFFVVGLALWAFRTALGGQSAFAAIKLDEA